MTLKNDLLIDKRIVQRNIEQGKLDPAEYQKLLDALPDSSDKVWRRTESSGTQGGTVVKKSPLQAPFAPRVQEPAAAAGFDQSAFSPDEDDDDEDDDDLDDEDDSDDENDGEKASDDEAKDDDDDEDDEDDDGDEDADDDADSPA